MQTVRHNLLPYQDRIYNDSESDSLAIVGGTGSGKTTFASVWLYNKICKFKGGLFWFCSHNSSTVNTAFGIFTTMIKSFGLVEGRDFQANRSSGVQKVIFANRWGGATVEFKSAMAWQSWVAASVFAVVADEPGRWPAQAHSELAERLRAPKKIGKLQRLYTGVPQGLTKFMEMFSGPDFSSEGVQLVRKNGERIDLLKRADNKLVLHYPTFLNNTIDLESYLRVLYDAYGHNKNLIRAHIYGEFCPLFESRVYDFTEDNIVDRPLDSFKDVYRINISSDFNLNRMAWTGWIVEGINAYCVAEAKRFTINTDAACDQIIMAFDPKKYGNCEVVIDGDASGHAGDTRGYGSDYDLMLNRLRPYYRSVWVRAPTDNGSQRSSILATNRGLCDNPATGRKKHLFFDRSVRNTHEGLYRTVYAENKIAKKGNEEDWPTDYSDSVRYFVREQYPFVEPIYTGRRAN